jgi:transcription factor E2F7/8
MVAASSTVVEVAVAAAAAAASALPQEQQARPRPMHGGGANGRHHAYSRKDKSLGLLCSKWACCSAASTRLERNFICSYRALLAVLTQFSMLVFSFVVLYNREDVESVGLDEAAKRLGVERRRIYDIVNVLESVGVSSFLLLSFWDRIPHFWRGLFGYEVWF